MASNLRIFLFTLIIVPLVISMMISVLYTGADAYNVTMDDSFSDTYSTINGTLGTTFTNSEVFQDKLSGENIETEGDEAGILNSVWSTIKVPFENLSLIQSIFTDVGNLLGVPAWVLQSLIALIVILIGVVILAVILRTTTV